MFEPYKPLNIVVINFLNALQTVWFALLTPAQTLHVGRLHLKCISISNSAYRNFIEARRPPYNLKLKVIGDCVVLLAIATVQVGAHFSH